MRYRLEKLNQVQYADDEIRKKELEAKGFHIVSTGADNRQEAGTPGGTGITEGSAEVVPPAEKPEETVKDVKKPKASKGSKKKPAAEENPEDAGTGREPEAAGGENQDAG